jgi:hypothetical protein
MEPLKCSNCKIAANSLCTLALQRGSFACIQKRAPRRLRKTFKKEK